MMAKHMIPLALRNELRPALQQLQRRWHESPWSTKPQTWGPARALAHQEKDFDRLLKMAADEFGITQIRNEIFALIERVRRLQPRTVVEVGTHKGGNSFLFCHAVPSVQRVVGVDLWVQNSAKLIHFARPGQVYRALHGDSQTAAMRDKAKRQLAGQPLDFLFIDGDHSYAGVRADFELYAPLVRPGGMIALHDIVADHRTRYGRDTGCYAGDVWRFWAELKQDYDCEELIDSPDQDGFGIGVVRVR
jgi:cephalosporin hydroxylase